MSTIVVTTFELADGVTSETFVEADARYQQDVAYQQPGLKRRTTTRSTDDPATWCIVETWGGVANAPDWHSGDLAPLIANVDRRTYETLD